jgi:O-antigen/teichoic acid export membrane protein
MKQKQILLNAMTTFGQELVSAGILFLLYRFLIHAIGIERFGVWSLVLATTSVVTLANQGFSTSVVKFVATHAAQERPDNVSALIQTAVISTGVALAIISIALYPAARWMLKLLLPAASLAEANQVLPFALLTLWINVVGGILLAGLTGFELVTQRNYVVLGGSILFLFLVYGLVPGRGLLGLAYAQTVQAIACLIAGWILLRRKVPKLPMFIHRWNGKPFREMRVYATHFQFITISQAIREPVTKALLARFGGLAMTGYYDMASRWVVSFRELIVQANQVLVPTVSRMSEREPRSLAALYRESYRLIFYLAIPTFAFVAIAAPIVSRLWIGGYEPAFVSFVELLAAGWLINVLANPAYVFDLGTGALRWVSIGCATTGVLNACVGLGTGMRFGASAVVAASASTLAFGYFIILVSYHVQNRVSWATLAPRESLWIVVSSIAGVLIFLPAFRFASLVNAHWMQFFAIAAGMLFVTIGIPMWIHPLRRRLLRWAISRSPA